MNPANPINQSTTTGNPVATPGGQPPRAHASKGFQVPPTVQKVQKCATPWLLQWCPCLASLFAPNKKVTKLQAQPQTKDKRLAELAKELAAKEATIASLEKELKPTEGDQEVQAKEAAIASLKEKLEETKQKLAAKETAFAALEKDLEAKDATIDSLKKKVKALTSQINNHKKESDEKDKERQQSIDTLEGEIHELKKTQSEYDSKLANLIKVCERFPGLMQQQQDTEQRLALTEQRHRALLVDLDKMIATNNSLRQRLDRYEQGDSTSRLEESFYEMKLPSDD